MSTIISMLFFLIPLGLFLFNAFRVRMEQKGPKGIAGERVSAKAARVARPARPARPARKARTRTLDDGPDCGSHLKHLVLTISGSRESCQGCAALQKNSRAPVPIREDTFEAASKEPVAAEPAENGNAEEADKDRE